MKLNSFLWNTFLESEKGRTWVEFFSKFQAKYEARDEKLKYFVTDWTSHGTLAQTDLDHEFEEVASALRELKQAEKDGLIPALIENKTQAKEYFEDLGHLVTDDEKDDLFYADDVPRLSIALYCLHPKHFFPYYFYPNFHHLKKIFNEFGIFLPPVPPKRDYGARFYFYLELCQSLQEYWSALGFLPEHLPVFLYGFAPEVVDLKYPKITELPKPHRAWFVGGGIGNNGDFEFLEKTTSSSQAFWQGNAETEEGDIVVMYCLSPRSQIHSIWRAIRPGGVEPFRYFYNTIWMGYPQRVKPLTLNEMKADPVFSKLPLVKGNMQGINGRQIPKDFYDRLLVLFGKKGTDLTVLPRLENREVKGHRIENERDVETRILEPLLLELGFKASDWERQVSLRVGRCEKVIPDYLIHPEKDAASHSVKAAFVWEAKHSIPTHKQLKRDFEQASSYARLVGAKGVGLVSQEGVWVSLQSQDYGFRADQRWSAQQLLQSDSLNDLRGLAGKKKMGSRE